MMIRIGKNNLHRATNIYEQEEEKEKKLLDKNNNPSFWRQIEIQFPQSQLSEGPRAADRGGEGRHCGGDAGAQAKAHQRDQQDVGKENSGSLLRNLVTNKSQTLAQISRFSKNSHSPVPILACSSYIGFAH